MVVATCAPVFPAKYRGVSGGQNSLSAWRQAPQGEVGVSEVGVDTATARNAVWPRETAANRALRSAQLLRPKDLFSTLVPVTMVPSAHRSAAPTGKWE